MGVIFQNTSSRYPLSVDVEIIEMEVKDIDEVLSIENVSFTCPWTRHSFEHELSLSHSKALIAKKRVRDKKLIVGYISFWRVLNEVHILNLATHPDFRRKGIATCLIESCLSSSVLEGAGTVTLEVRRSNLPAISLYEKYGFLTEGIRPGYYSDNQEDAVIMWLRIPVKNEK